METQICLQYPKIAAAVFYDHDEATNAVDAAGTRGTAIGSTSGTSTVSAATRSARHSANYYASASRYSASRASVTVSPLSTDTSTGTSTNPSNPHAQSAPRDLVDPELLPAATPPVTAPPNYSRHFVPNGYYMASSAVAELEQPHANGLGQPHADSVDRLDSPVKIENSPGSAAASQHRRGYQACDPCRKRKVKCDLGDVDKPQLGKCARCLREKKECVFSPTRRKRKPSMDTSGSDRELKRRHTAADNPSDETHSSQPSSAGYRIPSSTAQNLPPVSPSLPWNNAAPNQSPSQARPTTDNHVSQPWPERSPIAARTTPNSGQHLHSIRPTAGPKVKEESSVLNIKAAKMLNRPVSTSHEVLHLLAEAAEKSDKAASKSRASGKFPLEGGSTVPTYREPSSKELLSSGTLGPKAELQRSDPEINSRTEELETSADLRMALKAWSNMRFVRAGWFTASEGISYIEYYYEKLAPLTPVVLPDYRKPAAHLTLLTEEPLLAIAILLIASRYAKLKGPAHASRPINIQNVLWSHLRGMVERLLWGQEQFGGGFCGGGAVKLQEAKTGQINWKGSLRTLGTVEALLLMTEWQPRALHFPPGDDDDKLIHSRLASLDGGEADDQMEQSGQAPAFSHWLEPQWRSDRMSWMLLGLAQSLAFELGVFDASVEQGSDSSSECEVARKIRLRRLVLLYVSQTSGRLGITSPLSLSEYSHEFVLGTKDDNPIDVMQKLWLHIASIMNKANVEIFPSREVTRDLTTSGRYAAKVDEFWPLLKEWRKRYDQNRDKIDKTMQFILLMEYEYARLYINSLGVQAMVGQLTRIKSKQSHAVAPATLLDMYLPNQKYIREVYVAGREILMSTLDGLVPHSHLTHASVRTYSRILSGLIFSLKCLTFGATEPQYLEMLRIVDDTTTNLRDMVVDDVHLASHSADLITRLTKHLRSRFSRFTINPSGSESASRDRTPAPIQSQHQGLHYARQNGAAPLEPIPEDSLTQPFGYQFEGNQFQHNTDLDDLLGQIPTQPMAELENMTDSYMPPPDYNTYINHMDVPGHSDAAVSASMMAEENAIPDWLAVPLNNFFNNSTMPVDQGFGGIGPTVGDRDMLELAMNSQYTRWGGNSTSFQGGF